LAWPIALQQLVSSTMFMADQFMLGFLGETELAASTQANQLSALLSPLIFGISSAASIFAAQFFGAQNKEGIRHTQLLSLLSAVLLGLISGFVALFWPRQFLSLYSKDPAVLATAARYLNIVAPCALLSGLSASFSSINKAVGKVRLPMLVSLLGAGCNIVLNYLLIFGRFGLPRLGVAGAAWATLAATALECALMLGGSYLLNYPSAIRRFSSPNPGFIGRFLATALPILLTDGLWGLGVSVMFMVYGRLGTSAVAAVSIAGTIERFSQIFTMSMVTTSSILIGQAVGKGNRQELDLLAKQAMMAAFLLALAFGALITGLGRPVASLFHMPVTTLRTAGHLIAIVGLCLPGRMMGFVGALGILRAGGDALYAGGMELSLNWGVSVLLVVLFGLLLKAPIELVFFLSMAEDVPKFLLAYRRFKSGKWLKPLGSAQT
jgi:putative MATE family efflux protein